MVLEQALFAINPGEEADFEAALDKAKELVRQAHGFRSLRLLQGIEQPSSYLLLIEWETLEDHMVGFRESELFARWRALIGPHFATPPVVAHFSATDGT